MVNITVAFSDACNKGDQKEILALVDTKGQDPSYALRIALYRGDLHFAAFLCRERGASPRFVDPNTGMNALHYAAFGGSIGCVRAVLTIYNVDLPVTGTMMTPLMLALERDNFEAAKYLVSKGADLFLENAEGLRAIDIHVAGRPGVTLGHILNRGGSEETQLALKDNRQMEEKIDDLVNEMAQIQRNNSERIEELENEAAQNHRDNRERIKALKNRVHERNIKIEALEEDLKVSNATIRKLSTLVSKDDVKREEIRGEFKDSLEEKDQVIEELQQQILEDGDAHLRTSKAQKSLLLEYKRTRKETEEQALEI
jgi:hypothetical protein